MNEDGKAINLADRIISPIAGKQKKMGCSFTFSY